MQDTIAPRLCTPTLARAQLLPNPAIASKAEKITAGPVEKLIQMEDRLHDRVIGQDEAVTLLESRYAAAPHPENLFELAEARWLAGHRETARAEFARFEREARAEMEGWDNANRELIRYYAEYADRTADAVELAAREADRRHDVFTLDAYALALHRHGAHREAAEQMQRALAPGIRHPGFLLHAGAISLALGDTATAALHLHQVVALTPAGPLGAEARRLLGTIR